MTKKIAITLEKLKEQIAQRLAELDGVDWDFPEIRGKGKYLNVPRAAYLTKAKQVLSLIKEAGYPPVEPAQLEALSDDEIMALVDANVWLTHYLNELRVISQKTIAHNTAKFGQLYRIKPEEGR